MEVSFKAEPLSRKVVQGGIWSFAITFVNRVLGFIRTIVLARLLVPEDFGLLGIAFLSLRTLECFTQSGLDFALIQKKTNVQPYLDTAWTVSFIRGIILFFVLLFLSPVIAKFFNSSDASAVIKVVAISLLLNGLRNIGIVFFQKELQFNKHFTFTLSYTLTDLIVSVTLAFLLRSVWALVWGSLAGNFIRLIMSYAMHPYRPRIRFDKTKFDDLFGFGKWIFGSGILVFLITEADDIFVAKMLGTQALGLYQMAYLISNLPSTEISRVISQVTFPAFTKLQNEYERLRTAYLHVLQMIAYIATPLAGGILILAPELIQFMLGENWMPMVPALRVLAAASAANALVTATGPILKGIGKPQVDTIWQALRLLVMITLIYPLTVRYGLMGTSLAVFFSILASLAGFSISIIRILQGRVLRQFIKITAFPLINTLLMVALIAHLRLYFHTINILMFVVLIAFGMISYAAITLLYDRYFNYGMLILIKEKSNFR